MIMTIFLLVIGVIILIGGLYFLIKEKKDREAQKIYIITSIIGALITIGGVVKIFL